MNANSFALTLVFHWNSRVSWPCQYWSAFQCNHDHVTILISTPMQSWLAGSRPSCHAQQWKQPTHMWQRQCQSKHHDRHHRGFDTERWSWEGASMRSVASVYDLGVYLCWSWMPPWLVLLGNTIKHKLCISFRCACQTEHIRSCHVMYFTIYATVDCHKLKCEFEPDSKDFGLAYSFYTSWSEQEIECLGNFLNCVSHAHCTIPCR